MNTIDTLRAEPVLTADRVVAAWAGARPLVRRALVAACAVAAVLSAVMPASPAVRWGIAVAGVLLAVAAMVDVHEHRLPNRLLAAALLASSVAAVSSLHREVVLSMVAGALVAGVPMLLVRLTRGVGMGDVKMAAVIGANVGAVSVVAAPVAIAIAALTAGLYGLLADRRRVALGPALWFGWAASLAGCAAGWLS
ncbi:MAG: prepilin peptidase [Ilumatobacteraceae bacterium]